MKNLKTLKDYYHLSNAAMAKRAGVSNGTIGRAMLDRVALDLDTLQSIASAFHLQVWQLLTADLDPSNPPVICQISEAEQALYARLRVAMKSSQ